MPRLSGGGQRLWPIDFIRGVAVLAMVFYHLMWDLHFFGLYRPDVTTGGWRIFARGIATAFLLLVGVSIVLTAERKSPAERNRLWLVRGMKLLGWALAITAVTRVFLGEAFVLFGILHLIAVALLLAPVMWRMRVAAPVLGILFVWLGVVISGRSGDVAWLIPFGVSPPDYPAVDYFPLFPWLGVVMIGLGAGQWLRARLARHASRRGRPPAPLTPVVAIGRHALAVYIAHQPVILAVLWTMGYTVW